MKKNKAKEKLASGQPVFMCMSPSHAPGVVEVLGLAGFDIVCIDGEHAPLDRQTLERLVRAAECVGITSIFRTALDYSAEILPFLDTGVMGVMTPHCTTAEKAQMLVDAVKYAPLGKRGMTPGRANAYGVSGVPSKEYIEASNRETMTLVMIEDVEGVENLPEILQVEEIDVFDIGAGDLARDLGYPGQSDHPRVVEVIEHIIDLAYAAGRVTSNPARDAETRRRWFNKGARLIVHGGDTRMLFNAAVSRLAASQANLA